MKQKQPMKPMVGLHFKDRKLYLYNNGELTLLALFVSDAAVERVQCAIEQWVEPENVEMKK